ncbi:hypothetical protein F4809DRAFT_634794 [Biscogniauxia mediterranea]|nr:hypothetical protein F4809DRAFT_634794 [Biscogniauxia mediterranea]
MSRETPVVVVAMVMVATAMPPAQSTRAALAAPCRVPAELRWARDSVRRAAKAPRVADTMRAPAPAISRSYSGDSGARVRSRCVRCAAICASVGSGPGAGAVAGVGSVVAVVVVGVDIADV